MKILYEDGSGQGSGGGMAQGGAGGGEATASGGAPASGGNASGGAPSDWKASLPQDLRDNPVFHAIKDVDTLAKSYVHAQSMVGRDKIPVPGPNATPEEWAMINERLGVPKELDKYELTSPDNTSPEVFNDFKKMAHGLGIRPSQAKAMIDWNVKTGQAIQEQQTQAAAQAKTKNEESLKAKWGEGYEKELQRSVMAMEEWGGPDLKKVLEESGVGNNPVMIEMFNKLGKAMGEDKIRGKENVSFGVTPDEAKSQVNSIMGDPKSPYFDAGHPKHHETIEHVKKLYTMMYRGKTA